MFSPATQMKPLGHAVLLAEVDPLSHRAPSLQGPEHRDEFRPTVPPYSPSGQGTARPSPVQYLPRGQTCLLVRCPTGPTEKYPGVTREGPWAPSGQNTSSGPQAVGDEHGEAARTQ